ncbi:hypothetical protein GGR28_000680 [Lewinella aquimaris]|uniref:Uncharacterized protein n=1 Tax=Neolewinella aquimaris TaxID=1835722 RepID=A0A840E8G0_9BACT|nr:hypothetical protein [Neolewinella aquimaris]MBB4078079.1 hypothetical protein [Neolewinella aquimaris]
MIFLGSCGPATPERTVTPAGLIMGFDLSETALGPEPARELLKQIRTNGGNYLRLDVSNYGPQELRDLLTAAAKAGVSLDTVGILPPGLLVDGIAQFNRQVLEGGRGGVYRKLTQSRLNSLRALRTVERYIDFSGQDASPDLLAVDNPSEAVAAADTLGNYVIYIPTTGRVTIRLPENEQVRRRVTVIGHLGTQRSETLNPPYDREFSLLSNDERGGWMVITRLP